MMTRGSYIGPLAIRKRLPRGQHTMRAMKAGVVMEMTANVNPARAVFTNSILNVLASTYKLVNINSAIIKKGYICLIDTVNVTRVI